MRLIDADELLERINSGKSNVLEKTDVLGVSTILLGFYSYFESIIKDSKTIENEKDNGLRNVEHNS